MSISWHRAAALCGGDIKRNPGWPERLSAEQVAMLLAEGVYSDYRSIERAVSSAIASGELSASDGCRERDVFKLLRGAVESERLRTGPCKMLDAKAVQDWLSRQGEPENGHISAWVRAWVHHGCNEELEYSRAFNLYAELGEKRRDLARLAEAARATTGTERESNLRQADEVRREVGRIEAELEGIKAQPVPAEAYQVEGAAPETLTPMKLAAIIERLGRRYPTLESALNRTEEWAKECRVPGRRGWYYLERIEAECRARYGGAAPAPASDLSPAAQLRRAAR